MGLDQIPEELKQLKQWLVWTSEPADKAGEKPKKIPRQLNGYGASSINLDHWITFEQAIATIGQNLPRCKYPVSGIGFVFTSGDNYIGIDLDDFFDGNTLAPEAADVVEQLSSFTEISQSGKGLHIIARYERPLKLYNKSADKKPFNKAARPTPNAAKRAYEVYTEGRYFAITGDIYEGRAEIRADAAAIEAFYSSVFSVEIDREKRNQEQARQRAAAPISAGHLSDTDILNICRRSGNGDKFAALYDLGDLAAHNGSDKSHSGADMALFNLLAPYASGEEHLIQLFKGSLLNRPGKEKQYITAARKALESRSFVYDPQHSQLKKARADFSSSLPASEAPKPQEAPTSPPAPDSIEIVFDLPDITQEETPSDEEIDAYLLQSAAFYSEQFADGSRAFSVADAIPTGFNLLDHELGGGLFEGLYFIGAISSLGKTTFVIQMADQIAAAGHDVLFFSLEMSRDELVAKSLSRITFQMGDIAEAYSAKLKRSYIESSTGQTIRRILQGKAPSKIMAEAVEKYNQYAGNIYIKHGLGDISPEDVRAAVAEHERITGRRPVVFIDYLQILKPLNDRASDKQNTDQAVVCLKRISRDYKIPIVGISSFNRENYKNDADMTAFKESGAIEYSSDVLIVLQYLGMGQSIFIPTGKNNKDGTPQTRKIDFDIEAATLKQPREVELKILKQRNGNPRARIQYKYYSVWQTYEEIPGEQQKEIIIEATKERKAAALFESDNDQQKNRGRDRYRLS